MQVHFFPVSYYNAYFIFVHFFTTTLDEHPYETLYNLEELLKQFSSFQNQ